MGQKVNPHGARVGVILDWSTKWYAGKKDFSNNLVEDFNLRKMLKEKLYAAGISHIDIERPGERGQRGGNRNRAPKHVSEVKGIKTQVSGRLGGADIARSEGYHDGSIPLQTLRANIDYGFAEAKTTYGRIGVKVWIYKGQVLPKSKKSEKPAQRT